MGKCSILDVWQCSEDTSRYTGMFIVINLIKSRCRSIHELSIQLEFIVFEKFPIRNGKSKWISISISFVTPWIKFWISSSKHRSVLSGDSLGKFSERVNWIGQLLVDILRNSYLKLFFKDPAEKPWNTALLCKVTGMRPVS